MTPEDKLFDAFRSCARESLLSELLTEVKQDADVIRAQAAVCDAYLATRPDKDVSVEVWRAVTALQAKQADVQTE